MTFPDYYRVLGIAPTATSSEIRTAYKKKSLKEHPDRLPGTATEAQRRRATETFQVIADAYYVLSDDGRRRAYDAQRSSHSFPAAGAGDSSVPGGFENFASADFFSQFFSKARESGYATEEETDEWRSETTENGRPDPESVFGDVFEELLRPEVQRVAPFWSWAGMLSGATLGFIVGNLPGAALGGYGGKKLGAIRDAKGKAVYEVFKDLPMTDRATVLKNLAFKVLGSAL